MHKFSLFLLGIGITVLSELIGSQVIPLGSISITILPMFYAVILGFSFAPELLGKYIAPLQKILDKPNIQLASKLAGYAIIVLGVRLGFSVGPNIIGGNFSVGPAFIAQEFGHFFTPIIALPLALALGLKREAIGATSSISREGPVGIITERYGVNSPEGRGVLSIYIIGSILGTIIFSLIGSLAIYSGLHPYALAMACGVGSASMMAAAATALAATAPPEMNDLILTYAAASNLVSAGITGVYFLTFATLPFTNWYYDKLYPIFYKTNKENPHENIRKI